MLLVCFVRFPACFFPVAIVWEEGIGLFRRIVNLCETQTVSHSHRLLIDAGTSYDIDVLVGLATLQGCLQVREDFAARERWVMGDG